MRPTMKSPTSPYGLNASSSLQDIQHAFNNHDASGKAKSVMNDSLRA